MQSSRTKWCRKVLAAVGMSVGALAMSSAALGTAAAAEKFVALTQIVDHPSIDAIRKGFEDGLAARGYEPGKTIKWEVQSAQGSPATAAQIARKFVGDGPDVIVAIGTPSAQALAAATKTIPIVFAGLSDPIGAKLVESIEHPGHNVTGSAQYAPVGHQLDLVKELVPAVSKIGVIYNPGEANSVAVLERIKQESQSRGVEIVESTANRSSDVAASAQSLVGKVDALFVPQDNTAVSALESIIHVAYSAKIPFFASDTGSVERGALASVGMDEQVIGELAGQIAADILEGKKPQDIPVALGDKTSLAINLKSAKRMGVTIPDAVVARALHVVE
jgi:putative tryptophan/tyrosine transport system substrate-binding protein